MKLISQNLRVLAPSLVMLSVIGCTAGISGPPTATVLQTQIPPSVGDVGVTPSSIVATTVPVSLLPPDWVLFTSESPKFSLYHAPGWTSTLSGFRAEFHAPTGYAWVEIDLLSPENPGLAGEGLASGADFNLLSAQLEASLKENGSFGPPETLTTSSGGKVWLIEGTHDNFGDNIIVGLVTSGKSAFQFIGHQGDSSENWENLSVIYRQMIQSLSF